MSEEKKVVCPFCFRKVKVVRGQSCPATTQAIAARKFKGIPCEGADGGIPIPAASFEGYELFPIVVMGGRDAGKTVYLTALAWALEHMQGWGNFWEVGKIDYKGDPFVKSMGAMFQDRIFPSMTQSEGKHYPLLRTLRMRRHPWIPRWMGERKLLLCFTDPAGENFHYEEKNAGELQKKYPVLNGHAKGAIAVMDPVEVNSQWAAKLDAYRGSTSRNRSRASDSLSALRLTGGQTKVPVAVCLVKFDELMGKTSPLPASEQIACEGVFRMDGCDTYQKEPGRFSWRDMQRGDQLLRSTFYERSNDMMFTSLGVAIPEERNGPEVLWSEATLKDASFRYHAFFGVSATGLGNTKIQMMGGGRKVALGEDPPKPFRVLDPLLWILWQHGYLWSAKGRTT